MTLDKALSLARWHLDKNNSPKYQRPETIFYKVRNGQWMMAGPTFPGKPKDYWSCKELLEKFDTKGTSK